MTPVHVTAEVLASKRIGAHQLLPQAPIDDVLQDDAARAEREPVDPLVRADPKPAAGSGALRSWKPVTPRERRFLSGDLDEFDVDRDDSHFLLQSYLDAGCFPNTDCSSPRM